MKTQKGITLIALIITIIVMLILVGVSVSVALNTGLFSTAQGAAKNTEAEKANEVKISNGTVNIDGDETNIKEYVDGLSGGKQITLPEDLSVGDIVEYTPSSDYTEASKYTVSLAGCSGSFYTEDFGSWRVVSVNDDGTIKLTSEKATTDGLTLTGAHGYNNGIDALNTICATLYGSTENNKYYVELVESIDIEDLEEAGATITKEEGVYELAKTNHYFPISYLKSIGINEFEPEDISKGYVETTGETISSVTFSSNNPGGWLESSSHQYWLANKFEKANIQEQDETGKFLYSPCFGLAAFIQSVVCPEISENPLGMTMGSQTMPIRPVVTIKPKVELTLDETKTASEGVECWKFK